jgi:hypothetical protein
LRRRRPRAGIATSCPSSSSSMPGWSPRAFMEPTSNCRAVRILLGHGQAAAPREEASAGVKQMRSVRRPARADSALPCRY